MGFPKLTLHRFSFLGKNPYTCGAENHQLVYSEIPDETENFGNGKVRDLHNVIYRFQNSEVEKPKSEIVENSRKISMKHFRH